MTVPPPPRRVLVCGGRDYGDRVTLFDVLDRLAGPHATIIHGAARGADNLAGEWARARGVPEIRCPADWNTHGKRAGFLRNKSMLDDHAPQLVVAFPGGRGTADMVRQATAAGVPVVGL